MIDNTDLKLDQWQEEEKTVQVTEPEVQFDAQGRPTSVELKTVDKTVKERFMYTRLSPHTICAPDEHFFAIQNNGQREHGRVIVQCTRCSTGSPFIVGRHSLIDGKIIETTPE